MARAPYGFYQSVAGKLIPEPTEQSILKTIRSLRDEGYSFRLVADKLKELGIKTRDGFDWHYQRIEVVCNQRQIMAPIYFRPTEKVKDYLSDITKDSISFLINKLVENYIERSKNGRRK